MQLGHREAVARAGSVGEAESVSDLVGQVLGERAAVNDLARGLARPGEQGDGTARELAAATSSADRSRIELDEQIPGSMLAHE
jgi:hypothetical protein